ncbi:MAG: F-type H+-transporting ATPase subunit gamma [Thermoanaerobacteraceae bacterium]|nr:F-type H+-transporting ATPase subunit gamma [Thermoanaerobacteraceae bacterium]
MSGIRDIKRRLSSIKNMRKITGAMYMVSSARLKVAQKKALDFGDVFDRMQEIMAKIPATLKNVDEYSPVFIVMASDRGLAGGYNADILKVVLNKIKPLNKFDVITIGAKAKKFFSSHGIKPLLEYTDMEKEISPEALEEISERAIKEYESNRSIFAVYTHFKSPGVQEVKVVKILPPEKTEKKEKGNEKKRLYIFEPSPEELINLLVKFYVKMSLYGFYLHSYASEQAFRMRAMESATENADDLLEDLSLKFHQERKAIITREITEIVSGAENYLH